WRDKAYNLPFTKMTLLEIFFGVYGILGTFIAIFSGNPVFVPLIGIQTLGFFYISYLSISHTTFKKNKSQSLHNISKAEKMANSYYKLAMVGIVGFIGFGAFMAYYGYYEDAYPLDQSRGLLDAIQRSEDSQSIITDLKTIKTLLPKEGNPVWIFPTETTNFGRIQNDLDTMILSVEKIATVPQDSSSFHTGMIVIHEEAFQLRLHLLDATPYTYVSFGNVLFSAIWVGVIMGIFAILKRKKERLKSFEMADDV
ncbi:MAG TPA: glycosyl transferase, partial [Nitrosopumilaceae archaeon]|nr:glycosyl transferase [Nitrosopumilaceae archaeon]